MTSAFSRWRLPFPLSCLAGVLAVALLPTTAIGRLADASGIAALLPVVPGLPDWAGRMLLAGLGAPVAAMSVRLAAAAVARRGARAAPPRRPMRAADLGTPLMEVAATAPAAPPAASIEALLRRLEDGVAGLPRRRAA